MENTQKVRHIPIFVEGRDEPIVNKDHSSTQSDGNAASAQNSSNTTSSSADSSSGPYQQQQQHHQNPYFQHQNHNFGRPPMNFSDMDMGEDIGYMPHGSIFERTKDFPVRSDFPDFFNVRTSTASPHRRSESPINQQHQQPQLPRKSPSGGNPVQIPVQHEAKKASTPQRQQTPPKQQQQPLSTQQEPAQTFQQQQTEEEKITSAKQKALEDSITKIQKIQQSVLELMSRVEKFNGEDRKEYMFLDEMLTQNLLKLDNIDAEGKDNIKNARREAIKCINSLISLLEAKNDEAAARKSNSNNNCNLEKSKSNEEANENMDKGPPNRDLINGASKNSSYDNVNHVQNHQADVPEKSAEANLEERVAEALSKQAEQ